MMTCHWLFSHSLFRQQKIYQLPLVNRQKGYYTIRNTGLPEVQGVDQCLQKRSPKRIQTLLSIS